MLTTKDTVKDYTKYRSTVCDICTTALNAKIPELEQLDPSAEGEPFCHKTDAELCSQVAARANLPVNDTLVEYFRAYILELGKKTTSNCDFVGCDVFCGRFGKLSMNVSHVFERIA
ncbi:hypothetical protein PSPO01_06777 [Paraphaeosphaeria sporulosa]